MVVPLLVLESYSLSVGGTAQVSSLVIGSLNGMLKVSNGTVSGTTGVQNYVAYWTDNYTIGAEAYLPVTRGGIGTSALTANGLLIGNGTAPVQVVTPGTPGQFLIISGSSAPSFVTMGGDVTIGVGGTATIHTNSVELGADTTGNYIAGITAGAGLYGDIGSEGGIANLYVGAGYGIGTTDNEVYISLLNATDSVGSTASYSGLEFGGGSSNQLTLLQGCNDNEVLVWDEDTDTWI